MFGYFDWRSTTAAVAASVFFFVPPALPRACQSVPPVKRTSPPAKAGDVSAIAEHLRTTPFAPPLGAELVLKEPVLACTGGAKAANAAQGSAPWTGSAAMMSAHAMHGNYMSYMFAVSPSTCTPFHATPQCRQVCGVMSEDHTHSYVIHPSTGLFLVSIPYAAHVGCRMRSSAPWAHAC